jgi:hypothetical protein
VEARTWDEARALAAAAALVGAVIRVLSGVFSWAQLSGAEPAGLQLRMALREVDATSAVLVLVAALAVVSPPETAELAPLRSVTRAVATAMLVLGVVQVLNAVTLSGGQIETADRLQLAFEGGLPAAALAYAARRIAIGRGVPDVGRADPDDRPW